MADLIKLKKGPQANLPNLNLAEPAFTTDEERLYIGGLNGNVPLPNKQDITTINSQLEDNTNKIGILSDLQVSVETYPIIAPEVDDTGRINRAIQAVLDAGGGKLEFANNKIYNVSGSLNIKKAGDARIFINGNGATIKTSSDIRVFDIQSTVTVCTEYRDRIQHVYLRDLKILQTSGKIGCGVYLMNFGFIGFYNIEVLGFHDNWYLWQGSELIASNIRGAGGIRGITMKRDTSQSPGADFASAVFIECNFHNNDGCGVIIDGVRQVTFIGGSLIGTNSETIGAVLIKGTINNVDYVHFLGTNFENTSTANGGLGNSAVQIGDTTSTKIVTLVNFESCQFATATAKKIVVHSNLHTLNVNNCSVDTNHTPFILIKPTQITELVINIEGCYPYWTKYNIYDERSTTSKTSLNLHKSPCVNPVNTDFKKSYYGYTLNAIPTIDTVNYVTGNSSLLFKQDGTEKYINYIFYCNGNEIYIPEGSIATIEYIANFGKQANALYALTTDINGQNLTASPVPQCFTIQKFSNGFCRKFTEYTVPSGRKLIGFRLTNAPSMTTDLAIDYLEIHSNDTPVNHEINATSAPTSGTWSQGDKVRNQTPEAGGYIGWVCVSSGTPGTWKGYGAIQA